MKIRVSSVWTGEAEALLGPHVLEVEDGVVQNLAPYSDSMDIDVEVEATAIPGLIDCHEHIGIDVGDERAQSFQEAGEILVRGVANLDRMVKAGITTIRDCGERPDVERFWIEALERGVITGPRVVRSQTPICRTGGHAWYLSDQADGADGVRAAVRRRVRDGADFIKVMATGGMGTVGSDPLRAEFTKEELLALVAEAHRLGRKVAAHAHGGTGVDDALEAGVDSIEHGTLLTIEQLKRMASQGTFLVSTQGVGKKFESDPAVPLAVREKIVGAGGKDKDVMSDARAQGVKVVLGTDCVHGALAEEAGYLAESGFTAIDCLRAATCDAADLLGRDDVGVIRPGAAADLVFVDGDPTRDVTALKEVVAVMAGGQWMIRRSSASELSSVHA